jgi:hypothetical protein
MQPEADLALGASIGILLGWLGASKWAAAWFAAREVELSVLSDECERFLRDVEPLRSEEQRVRPLELLDESTRASDQIDALRRRLLELGLYDGPPRVLPTVSKPRTFASREVSDEQERRGPEWWREQR